MGSTLVTRTIGGVDDKRVNIYNAEIRRAMDIGSDWSKIKIGMLYTLYANNAASLGNSYLSIGVCAGASDGWARTTSVHCVGARMINQQLNPVASTPHYHVAAIAGVFVASKRVGSTVTSGLAVSSSAPMFINEPTTNRACFFVEITKGSPNFSIQFGAPTTAAAVQTDISPGFFRDQMDAPAWVTRGLSSWLSGYNIGSVRTLAVDEATDGYLTAIAIHHNIAGSIDICDVAAERLA